MKAIIHIGTEKTGTTTIQEFLNLNREKLHKQGVAYLKSPGLRNQRNLAVYAMSSDNIDNFIRTQEIGTPQRRSEWNENFLLSFRNEIKALDSSIHSVIFSSEHLHSRLRSVDEVVRLHQLLAPIFEEFKIVVYLRPQDQLALSSYSTKLKYGSIEENVFAEKMESENKYYNYYSLIKRWETAFGNNVIIRIFDKSSFFSGNLLCDFMQVTGIKHETSLTIPDNLNEKLSAEAQYLLLRYNRRYPRFKNNLLQILNDRVRFQIVQYLENQYKGNPCLPARKDAQDFYQIFQQSNTRLAKEYFNRNDLFELKLETYPLSAGTVNLSKFKIVQFDYYVKYRFLRTALKHKFQAWSKQNKKWFKNE